MTREEVRANTDAVASAFGGNFYPHAGSVVYVGNGADLVLDSKAVEGSTSDTELSFDSSKASVFYPVFSPAYFLLHEGGALYGQGNHVSLDYVALERDFSNRYAMLALPFDQTLNATYVTRMDGEVATAIQPVPTYYNYDGAARSAYGYKLMTTDSQCWKTYPDGSLGKTEGLLVDLGSEESGRFVRFTAVRQLGEDEDGNATDTGAMYVEDGSDKTIALTQHDKMGPATENNLYFTHEYDMGWNLKGLPWLISGYNTAAPDASGYYHAMSSPHIVYPLNADGASYGTVSSWTEGAAVDAGKAFFTQTFRLAGSASDNEEEVTFHSLLKGLAYDTDEDDYVTRALLTVAAGEETSAGAPVDAVTFFVEEEGGTLQYAAGSDGAKLSPLASALQVYAIGDAALRMSLLSQTPADRDIPLGVSFPQAGSYRFETTMAEGGEAWLTDRLTGAVTNIAQEAYVAKAEEAEDDVVSRFSIRFGRKPMVEELTRYGLQVRGQEVTVTGLSGGETIRVFTTGGHKVDERVNLDGETASSFRLDAGAVYVITVDRTPFKVRI